MSYLITLGSREGDVVLDPFVGSGTTCIAAEMLNRKWLGIEISKEYCKIASARLSGAEIIRLEESTLPNMTTERKKQTEIKRKDVICPKCKAEMYEGKHGYYCTKANCDGRRDK